ncbi:MAG TPA: nucleotidyltransferase domain-containing protein [Gammaproteobacteria bacterium]|nr:nucleotidyltransferase domain-containing protein [Gammaproteobacteria bacterium]
MRSNTIGNVLFTKTQQKVLGLLYGQPYKSFYLNEIVRLSDIGRGTIKRELERMTASGIIIQKRIGNQNHYQANESCPVYQELLGIVRKTFGIADVIKTALTPIFDRILFAFIYGSIAKSEDSSKSDIDLLVISDKLTYSEVMERLIEVEGSLGRVVNPTIYDLNQIKQKLNQDNAFVARIIEQPKIWIKEDQDVFDQFG